MTDMCNSDNCNQPGSLSLSRPSHQTGQDGRDPWDVLRWPEQLSVEEFLAQSAQVEREASASEDGSPAQRLNRAEMLLVQISTALSRKEEAASLHRLALVQLLEDVAAYLSLALENENEADLDFEAAATTAELRVLDFNYYRRRKRGQF